MYVLLPTLKNIFQLSHTEVLYIHIGSRSNTHKSLLMIRWFFIYQSCLCQWNLIAEYK